MNPAALIFDCDGTLADTMPLHWQAWQVIQSRHQFHFPEDRFYSLGGVPSREILTMLKAEQLLEINPIAVALEKEETYLAMAGQVEPVHAIVEIARAHAGLLPMAVASGGTRKVIHLVLEKMGIRDLFQVVVTSEDVQRQKPAPDIFLEAARQLGVDPTRCRGYEDTDLGMEAIRAAGMEAVDVREILKARHGA
ncbi:MAG: HAD family hydrolase [Limisphaerales bacterium]